MANPNDVLMDALIRHAVYLGRYTKEQLSRVLGVLEGAHQGLILEVMRGTSKADQTRLLDTIQQLYGPAMRTVAEQMTSDARELAAYEVERSGKLADSIGISFKMPAPTAVFDAVMASPADRGNTMKVLFDKFDRNTIDRISAVIRQGITEGLNPTAMVRALRGDVVKPARWIVQGGKKVLRPGVYRGGVYETTSRGAETLARTVTMHVYNTANAEVARENADLLSGVRWSATLDMDTCPDCAALDGQDWEVEDPHPEPPLHPNCLPGDTLISSSSRVAAISKRKYHGDLFVIRTASGLEIRCTPNHPILTDTGFIPAQSLNLGQNVIRDAGIDRVFLGGEHENNVVSSIEELASSFLKSGKMTARKVPMSPEDFHHDAVDNEVAVVLADWELLKKSNASLPEFVGKNGLVGRNGGGHVQVSRLRALLKLFLGALNPQNGFMRGISKRLAFFRSRILHALDLLLVSIAQRDTMLLEHACDIGPSGIQPTRYSIDTDPLVIQRENLVDGGLVSGTFGSVHDDASVVRDITLHDISADAKLARELIDGHSGPVAPDQIVDIRKIDFLGHVYNLQTAKGFYIANGIITHNCRCVLVLQVKGHENADSPRYEDWLGRQSEERQNDILGVGRAEIFRSGATLSDMSDAGGLLTLAQLREKDLA